MQVENTFNPSEAARARRRERLFGLTPRLMALDKMDGLQLPTIPEENEDDMEVVSINFGFNPEIHDYEVHDVPAPLTEQELLELPIERLSITQRIQRKRLEKETAFIQ